MSKPAIEKPIYVIAALDGGPFEGDCECPVCAMMHREGIQQHTVDANGELREVAAPTPRPSISVLVRPSLETAPYLGTLPLVEEVPSGTTAWALVEYLVFTRAELRGAFLPPELGLRRGRSWLSLFEEVVDSEELVLAVRSM